VITSKTFFESVISFLAGLVTLRVNGSTSHNFEDSAHLAALLNFVHVFWPLFSLMGDVKKPSKKESPSFSEELFEQKLCHTLKRVANSF
jgi:hypothetical protein